MLVREVCVRKRMVHPTYTIISTAVDVWTASRKTLIARAARSARLDRPPKKTAFPRQGGSPIDRLVNTSIVVVLPIRTSGSKLRSHNPVRVVSRATAQHELAFFRNHNPHPRHRTPPHTRATKASLLRDTSRILADSPVASVFRDSSNGYVLPAVVVTVRPGHPHGFDLDDFSHTLAFHT